MGTSASPIFFCFSCNSFLDASRANQLIGWKDTCLLEKKTDVKKGQLV